MGGGECCAKKNMMAEEEEVGGFVVREVLALMALEEVQMVEERIIVDRSHVEALARHFAVVIGIDLALVMLYG